MKIVQLTPGAGAMFCGSCLRDNTLVNALRRLGHDALMVPLYLPLRVDEDDSSRGVPLFYGGLSVYLQQKSSLFQKTPAFAGRLLAAPALLKWAALLSGKVRPEELGALVLSMLHGEHGRQVKELEKLTAWLREQPRPDVVCLSNVLLVGLARRIKEALNVPVVCTLHGEDAFLDALPEPQRNQAWAVLRERAADVDAFIPVSAYYGEIMRARLELPAGRLHVVHNGIFLNGLAPRDVARPPPVLGYFARLSPEKGLATLIEAFLLLKERAKPPRLRLRIGGSLSAPERPFVKRLQATLRQHERAGDVEWRPNVDRAGKLAFFHGLTAFSVPAAYGEAFGLYVLEALASGVPVVQPRHGAFPELLGRTGGGVLCEPDNAEALAGALEGLLNDPAAARSLGAEGRAAVLDGFGAERMAQEVLKVLETLARPGRPAPAALGRSGEKDEARA